MIVIPMAGLSSRFFKVGYDKPKYMLEAYGESIFEHSVKSFIKYFRSETFLFIIKNSYETYDFVDKKSKELGIKEYFIVILDNDTNGQAETVAVGVKMLGNKIEHVSSGLFIFNIDTFRPNFEYPEVINDCKGYLEVFIGSGDNWSFAKPESELSTKVIKTAEKKAISNLCSTGLYYFSDVNDFLSAFYEYQAKPKELWEMGELYIAPLYNILISKGLEIKYNLIERDDVVFCGTPDEYIDFLNKNV
jgi:dTDP-glucose pyrophosphorylase